LTPPETLSATSDEKAAQGAATQAEDRPKAPLDNLTKFAIALGVLAVVAILGLSAAVFMHRGDKSDSAKETKTEQASGELSHGTPDRNEEK